MIGVGFPPFISYVNTRPHFDRCPLSIRKSHSPFLTGMLAAVLLSRAAHAAITIQFDYTYDTSGFFTDPIRQNLLNAAALAYTSVLPSAHIAAIVPDVSNTWSLN